MKQNGRLVGSAHAESVKKPALSFTWYSDVVKDAVRVLFGHLLSLIQRESGNRS